MALKQNGTLFAQYPLRRRGGALCDMRSLFNPSRNQAGTASIDEKGSIPNGHLAPSAWFLPQIGGGMTSYNYIQSSGALSGFGALGRNVDAPLSGSGDLTFAEMQLVISAVAALSGAGYINTPDLFGKIEAAAALAGSGDVTGAIGALAGLIADILGSGTVSSAVPYAVGTMGANIRGYSDLTPEGLRDSVWNAILAQYQDSGTAGKALSLASSGGIDYAALAAAILAAAEAAPIASNIKEVNSIPVDGAGTEADPFGPV